MTEGAGRGGFVVSASHPALPGHFPGQPVVPGVVLLEETLALIGGKAAWCGPVHLERVRFTVPVPPEQDVVVSWRSSSPGKFDFVGHVAGREAFRGRIVMPGPGQ
jgi:3-hydroxymyristoyl/3-hydroxydecanoyl-(acyl carrier protein) dehydratase